ncbi:MAG: hypothetical protein R3E39_24140 [Anaerolineae bacterium]
MDQTSSAYYLLLATDNWKQETPDAATIAAAHYRSIAEAAAIAAVFLRAAPAELPAEMAQKPC